MTLKMSKGILSRILELDLTVQNASEQLEKITIKMSIVDAHLKRLLEKVEIGSSEEVFKDKQQEIAELERQLCSLKQQSFILGREKLDADVRKKNILRNQSKVHGRKAKAQVDTTNVESKLKSPIIRNEEGKETPENLPMQHEQSDPGNNNLTIVDTQNNQEQEQSIVTLDLMEKEDHAQDISSSLANKESIMIPHKSDAENNSYSLMISSQVGENRAAQDFIEEIGGSNKSSHSITSVISAEDDEFVPVRLPPKEDWQNPLLWRQQPSFSNKKFTAIKTSPPIDWNGRYKDLSSSSRSRSQSEDRSNPLGVAQEPQDRDRGANCRGRQSRSRVKRVQEMKDLPMTRKCFNIEGHGDTNDIQKDKSFAHDIYKQDLAIKTNGGKDTDSRLKNLTCPNKNAPSANDRLCKKYDNNNISDPKSKPNTVIKPDKMADMRAAAEMRKKMKEPVMYKPKSDQPRPPILNSTEHECICLRPLKMILCSCSNWFVGRVRTICPVHPQDLYLLDVDSCRECNSLFLKEYDMVEEDGGKLRKNSLLTN